MFWKRILTVVIAGPFVIGVIVCPVPWVFKVFVAACLGISLVEFFTIVGHSASERRFGIGLGLFHLLFLLFSPYVRLYGVWEMTLLVIAVFAYYCLAPIAQREGIASRVGLTLLGSLYIVTFGAYVSFLRELPDGIYWVLTALAMTWMNDTSAYFVGRRFGRRKLAPKISPGKTLEGFLGGFVGSFVGFLFFWLLLHNPVTFSKGLLLTFAVGLMGPLGDLSESLIKRSFGVKDSGQIIPGHGGMLDRIDALLFTAPVVYLFASQL